MSTSQIPNLNTLRRGGPRLRGRGTGSSLTPTDSRQHGSGIAKDEIIQRTDSDAATSRLSAVETGYLDDPFAALLAPRGETPRRLPLMNRGTYVRTSAIDQLVNKFCDFEPSKRKQIVSLGAGSDTRFFRLKRRLPDLDIVYHELDFPVNATQKIRSLQMTEARRSLSRICNWEIEASSISTGPNGLALHSSDYHIHPIDLQSLPGASRHAAEGTEVRPLTEIDPGLPTLIVSECCLIYLSPSDARAVLSYFTSLFPPRVSVGIIIYEPIRPHDAFGRTMVANLTARGIHLQTFNTNATLGAQRKRLKEHGFGQEAGGGIGAADVYFIWRSWVDKQEKERVEALEWMDEVEEWRLLMQHYCVVWGWRDAEDTAVHAFRGWQELADQGVDY